MEQTSAVPRLGYLSVVFAAAFWAVSGSSGKYLFNHGVTPFELVQMRVTLSAAFLFVILLIAKPSLLTVSLKDVPYFILLGTAGMAMVQFTYFYSISKIQVSVAILLEYLAPIFIALHAVLFARERLSRASLAAIIGTTTGCYLAVGAYNFDLLAMNWQGILAGVCSGLAFAVYAVMGERGMRRYNPWTVLFHSLIWAALFWNIALPPLHAFGHSHTLIEWWWIFYIALLGTVVPYGLYSLGISLIRSTRASVTATLEPILAALMSWFFLGERLEPLQILGGVIVILSVILLQMRRDFDDNTPSIVRRRAETLKRERSGDG